jgi:hypothetical protein
VRFAPVNDWARHARKAPDAERLARGRPAIRKDASGWLILAGFFERVWLPFASLFVFMRLTPLRTANSFFF